MANENEIAQDNLDLFEEMAEDGGLAAQVAPHLRAEFCKTLAKTRGRVTRQEMMSELEAHKKFAGLWSPSTTQDAQAPGASAKFEPKMKKMPAVVAARIKLAEANARLQKELESDPASYFYKKPKK